MSQSKSEKPKFVFTRPQALSVHSEAPLAFRSSSGILFSQPSASNIIGPVDWTQWHISADYNRDFSLESESSDLTLLGMISGAIAQQHYAQESDEELPPEATRALEINQALWRNVAFEFDPEQPITLEQLMNNHELCPIGTGFVSYARGPQENIIGAVLRKADDNFALFEQDQWEIPGIIRTVTSSSDLNDSSFARLGSIQQPWSVAQAKMIAAAKDFLDAGGKLAPITSPVIAVPAYSRIIRERLTTKGVDIEALPVKAVSVPDEPAWTALQQAILATVAPSEDSNFAMVGFLAYAIDSSKYRVLPYQPK